MKQFSNHEGKNPSTLHSHPSTGEGFTFPASVQSDLFNYLKPYQQKALKPYLRLIKRPYQEKLCVSLVHFLEGDGLNTLSEPVLAKLQEHIVEECNLRPLTPSEVSRLRIQDPIPPHREPIHIGTLIKQLFPSFAGKVE